MQPLGDVRVRALLERQPDVQADGLAAGLARAAVRGFHDSRAAARRDNEAVILRRQRAAPRRQQARQLARFLVVARPLERLARLRQLGLIVLVGAVYAASPERAQRPLGALAAVDAGRSEEHDRVLNLLIREAAERFEIFRQDANRPRIGALEELPVLVCERLLRHITPLYQL